MTHCTMSIPFHSGDQLRLFEYYEDTLLSLKEGNVLFNDGLNTFYLWLIIFSDYQQGIFYMHHPTAFHTPVVEYSLKPMGPS